jgi:hypothetical protein
MLTRARGSCPVRASRRTAADRRPVRTIASMPPSTSWIVAHLPAPLRVVINVPVFPCLIAFLLFSRAVALSTFRRSVAVAQWHLGVHHPFSSQLHATFADALVTAGDLVSAARSLTVARDLNHTVLSRAHASVGHLSLQLAYVLQVQCASCSLALPCNAVLSLSISHTQFTMSVPRGVGLSL